MQEQITTVQKLINTLIEFFVNYSFQVVGAIIILIIGLMIANSVHRLLMSLFEKKHLDITLSKFLAGMARLSILGFAVLIALGKFGITIAPFVAMLSATAFGASFAFQGPLSNFGAGLSIVLSRPFKVGDTITVAGQSGVVKEVKLSTTLLTDEDGIDVAIPNKHIVGEILCNSHGHRIVETVVGISYDDDPEKAIGIVKQTLARFSEVAKEPAPQVGLQEFAASSINMGLRYWVPTVKYFYTLCAVNLAIYKAFQSAGITIPFPQQEVRVLSQPSKAGVQS